MFRLKFDLGSARAGKGAGIMSFLKCLIFPACVLGQFILVVKLFHITNLIPLVMKALKHCRRSCKISVQGKS